MSDEKDRANELHLATKALEEDKLEEAIAILDKLVSKGDAEAMFLRAQVGSSEETEEQFRQRSVTLLAEAAELDHGGALYKLSTMYEAGDDVEQDLRRAKELLKKAVAVGHPHAMWIMGLRKIYGTCGEGIDIEEGKRLLETSARKKSQGALRSLASFYEDGSFGYPADRSMADKLRQSAEGAEVLSI